MALAETLKELRQDMGLTYEYLASRCGVSIRTVREWEASRLQPTQESVKRLAEAFGVPVDALSEGRKNALAPEGLFYSDLIGCYAGIDFGPYAANHLGMWQGESGQVLVSENERYLLTSQNHKLSIADKGIIVSVTADFSQPRPQPRLDDGKEEEFYDYFVGRACKVTLKMGYGQNAPAVFKGTVSEFSPAKIRLSNKKDVTVIHTMRLARVSQI
jgi:transcriptional regulator with XRE-family HTH domain